MSEPQGSAYAQFITDELGRELDRRDKLNAQAMGLLTTAGGLLIFAVAALAFLEGRSFVPIRATKIFFSAAFGAYLVAGGLALLASISRKYQVATGETLGHMITDHWVDSEVTARNVTAGLNIRTVGSLRTGNDSKALLLIFAAMGQVIAVLLLGVGVLITI